MKKLQNLDYSVYCTRSIRWVLSLKKTEILEKWLLISPQYYFFEKYLFWRSAKYTSFVPSFYPAPNRSNNSIYWVVEVQFFIMRQRLTLNMKTCVIQQIRDKRFSCFTQYLVVIGIIIYLKQILNFPETVFYFLSKLYNMKKHYIP